MNDSGGDRRVWRITCDLDSLLRGCFFGLFFLLFSLFLGLFGLFLGLLLFLLSLIFGIFSLLLALGSLVHGLFGCSARARLVINLFRCLNSLVFGILGVSQGRCLLLSIALAAPSQIGDGVFESFHLVSERLDAGIRRR